jgi:hypothetical protein
MGIKMDAKDSSKAPAFTRDVLRIEKSGPNEEHLTVIDVPGLFENGSPGLTTEADVRMVKKMVKDYIKDARTMQGTPPEVSIRSLRLTPVQYPCCGALQYRHLYPGHHSPC